MSSTTRTRSGPSSGRLRAEAARRPTEPRSEQWQMHEEFAALTVIAALRLDVPAVQLDQPAHQRQPNPETALRAVEGRFAG